MVIITPYISKQAYTMKNKSQKKLIQNTGGAVLYELPLASIDRSASIIKLINLTRLIDNKLKKSLVKKYRDVS